MAGHSRLTDGVLSPAYVPAIHVFDLAGVANRARHPAFAHFVSFGGVRSAQARRRIKPGMTEGSWKELNPICAKSFLAKQKPDPLAEPIEPLGHFHDRDG